MPAISAPALKRTRDGRGPDPCARLAHTHDPITCWTQIGPLAGRPIVTSRRLSFYRGGPPITSAAAASNPCSLRGSCCPSPDRCRWLPWSQWSCLLKLPRKRSAQRRLECSRLVRELRLTQSETFSPDVLSFVRTRKRPNRAGVAASDHLLPYFADAPGHDRTS